MFGAMVVFLQAQTGAHIHADAFDFETLVFVHAVVPAPRAVHFAVDFGFGADLLLQFAHQLLDVL